MNINLQILCMQAAVPLAQQFKRAVDLPSYSSFYGLDNETFQVNLQTCVEFVQSLMNECSLSYQDLFSASDIGQERLFVMKTLEIKRNSFIIDIGCGRGYTSFAAAMCQARVIGTDLMNGFGRKGWWRNWQESVNQLALVKSPEGLRSNGRFLPLRGDMPFHCLFVHALRNFPSEQTIISLFREMGRVTGKKGSVAIVESLPFAKNEAQKAHLRLFDLKVRFTQSELPLFPLKKLESMVGEGGLEILSSQIVDPQLASTPPLFWLDPDIIPANQRTSFLKEYEETVETIHTHGEVSPPMVVLVAKQV